MPKPTTQDSILVYHMLKNYYDKIKQMPKMSKADREALLLSMDKSMNEVASKGSPAIGQIRGSVDKITVHFPETFGLSSLTTAKLEYPQSKMTEKTLKANNIPDINNTTTKLKVAPKPNIAPKPKVVPKPKEETITVDFNNIPSNQRSEQVQEQEKPQTQSLKKNPVVVKRVAKQSVPAKQSIQQKNVVVAKKKENKPNVEFHRYTTSLYGYNGGPIGYVVTKQGKKEIYSEDELKQYNL